MGSEMCIRDRQSTSQYSNTEDAAKTASGKTIDLSAIGDMPSQVMAESEEMSFQIKGIVANAIKGGANPSAASGTVENLLYRQALNNARVMYDGLGIENQTSLLFDNASESVSYTHLTLPTKRIV